MRSTFRELAWRQLKSLKLRSLARAGATIMRLRAGRPPSAPLFITLAVTYRCNYRCGMCTLPLRSEKRMPSREQLRAILSRFASHGTVAVGLTGGEPTGRSDLEEIVRDALELGLIVHLNTNGSRLPWTRARSLLSTGLHSINISLDGARATTHDRLRGRDGSFATVVEAIARFLQVRRDHRAKTKVRLVMALGPENLDEIEEFVDLAAQLKADGVGFLPIHGFTEDRADFLDHPAVESLQERLATLRRGRYRRLLENSDEYIEGIAPYLAGHETPRHCSAPSAHLAVDPSLQTYPCVPLMTLGRAGLGAIDQDWDPARAHRSVPADVCRRCWWNCHRELDIALHTL